MTDFTVPDSAAFRRALERLVGQLPENYINMLKSHYAAPEHTTTVLELALSVGYKNYSAANLHYGKLAALLKSELEWTTGEFLVLNSLWSSSCQASGAIPRFSG